MTPNEVAAALAQLGRDLDACVRTLEGADREAVIAKENYTLAYAKAFLKAEGAMDVRRHLATVETHAERLAAETSEQIVRGLRRQLAAIGVRIDIGRSMNSAMKAELALVGAS